MTSAQNASNEHPLQKEMLTYTHIFRMSPSKCLQYTGKVPNYTSMTHIGVICFTSFTPYEHKGHSWFVAKAKVFFKKYNKFAVVLLLL